MACYNGPVMIRVRLFDSVILSVCVFGPSLDRMDQ